jgi:hypothetical protein
MDKKAHLDVIQWATMQLQDCGSQEKLGDLVEKLDPLYYSPITIRE